MPISATTQGELELNAHLTNRDQSLADRFDAWTYRVGRRMLAKRAQRLFGRAYGVDKFVVTPERLDFARGDLNHVQVTLQGFTGALLLYARNNINLFKVLCGYQLIRAYCRECGQPLVLREVPPFRRRFRRGIAAITHGSAYHYDGCKGSF